MKYKITISLLIVFNLLSLSQTNKVKKISVVDKDNNPVFRGFRSIRYMHQLKDNKSEFSEEDRLHYPYDYFISDESENNAVFYEVYKKEKKLNEVFFGYYQEYIKEGKDTIYYKIK